MEKKVPVDGKSSYNDEEKSLRSSNEELYVDLILNLKDEVSFGCVSRARNSNYKDVIEYLALEEYSREI